MFADAACMSPFPWKPRADLTPYFSEKTLGAPAPYTKVFPAPADVVSCTADG